MKPRFCPYKLCHMHYLPPEHEPLDWWEPAGFHPTKVVGPVERFRCLYCERTFSTRTFELDYYTKKIVSYEEILERTSSAECVNAIARNLALRPEVVTNRMSRLSRNGLAMHECLEGEEPLIEDLCADGFESFDRSQYFPNNINIVVGKNSQHLYGFSHTTIRRKGRMTKEQKAYRDELEKQYLAPRKGIENSFKEAMQIVSWKWNRVVKSSLALYTDEHHAYVRALARMKWGADPSFTHVRISSKEPRTFVNHLFSANYIDREFRKDRAEFHRESTCFVRNVSRGLERLAIYMVWHNYWKLHRINGRKEKPPIHAEVAGIKLDSIMRERAKLFTERAFLSLTTLADWAEKVWLRLNVTPLKEGPEYLPAFARG